MNQTIAIQSWCFRHFKAVPDFITQLKATGVSATELCALHANFNDTSTFAESKKTYESAGVKIVAIGVETMTGDPAKDKPKFEFCKALGIPNMSIHFAPELMDSNFQGLKNVDSLAEQYGTRIGIHNHGGYDWLGTDRILRYIFDRTKHIGLHMDTAWAIDAKQDPSKWAELFKNRLTGIHVKDFLYSEKREPRDVIIGTGILDLPKLFGTLKANNFTGPIVIEYELDEENPVPALKECVAKLKTVI
jgi:inosose dehydratase